LESKQRYAGWLKAPRFWFMRERSASKRSLPEVRLKEEIMPTFYRFHGDRLEPGSLVIKFYHSGDQIRGYIRRINDTSEEDAIFPGEEMEPEDAFRMADNKNRPPNKAPIFIELAEGVEWNPTWGTLI
jgi:hypothetical protein